VYKEKLLASKIRIGLAYNNTQIKTAWFTPITPGKLKLPQHLPPASFLNVAVSCNSFFKVGSVQI
jgi:hypothetical protein